MRNRKLVSETNDGSLPLTRRRNKIWEDFNLEFKILMQES